MTKRHLIPEAQRLLDNGVTQEAVAEHLNISDRTLRLWLKEGGLKPPDTRRGRLEPSAEMQDKEEATGPPDDAPPSPPDAQSAEMQDKEEAKNEPKVVWTARELLDLGLHPTLADAVLMLLDATAAQGNLRLHQWLSTYSELVPGDPEVWAAAVAWLPILGEDTGTPELGALAKLMRDSVPWRGGPQRRRYHRLAHSLLQSAKLELNLSMVPFSLHSDEPRSNVIMGFAIIQTLLDRCPDVDRKVRFRWRIKNPRTETESIYELCRSMPMVNLAMAWCCLLPEDHAMLARAAHRTRRQARAHLEAMESNPRYKPLIEEVGDEGQHN